MRSFKSRAGRRSLAQTILIVTAAAALGACADETTAPARNVPSRAARAEAPNQAYSTSVDLSVFSPVSVNPLYATVGLAVTCSSDATFDVIVELEQSQKVGSAKTVVQGSTTFPAVACSDGSSSFSVTILPSSGAFQPGRATVRARIANPQSSVEPAEVTRRVRMNADEVM
jgi:hypothetical protein